MKAWEEYAFVVDGIVQNVACFNIGGYTDANVLAHEVYGEECIAVNVTQIPTGIGDTYKDGAFYRIGVDGEMHEITVIATAEEQVGELETATATNTTSIDANTTAIDDILVMLLDDTSDTDATT